jgi:hypothetical protein
MTPIISEYQEGTRNARVYKTANGEYGVLLFDAEDDHNEFKAYATIDEAEDAAEDWVLGYDTI